MSSRYLRTVPKKTYTDQTWCPVARTLDLIGERWTLLILRDLLLKGPQRFQDLQNSLAGAAPNTLSARLKALEKQGLITRRLYSEHPEFVVPRVRYNEARSLIESGLSDFSVSRATVSWGIPLPDDLDPEMAGKTLYVWPDSLIAPMSDCCMISDSWPISPNDGV